VKYGKLLGEIMTAILYIVCFYVTFTCVSQLDEVKKQISS